MFYSGKKIKCKLQHGNWKLITKNWKARKLETKIPRSTTAAAAAGGGRRKTSTVRAQCNAGKKEHRA